MTGGFINLWIDSLNQDKWTSQINLTRPIWWWWWWWGGVELVWFGIHTWAKLDFLVAASLMAGMWDVSWDTRTVLLLVTERASFANLLRPAIMQIRWRIMQIGPTPPEATSASVTQQLTTATIQLNFMLNCYHWNRRANGNGIIELKS